jgi:hypothetical protein
MGPHSNNKQKTNKKQTKTNKNQTNNTTGAVQFQTTKKSFVCPSELVTTAYTTGGWE